MAGVLMPVSSLPSRDGVGSFGAEAYEFVDILASMGAKLWQILPLNPLSYGNSPYQPYSSFAGDPLYIDLGLLEKEGFLPKGRPSFEPEDPNRVDFEKVRAFKEPWLRKAYQAFREKGAPGKDYEDFAAQPWVYPYGVFITLKGRNQMRCWNEWPQEQQDWSVDGRFDLKPLEEEISYQIFLQYVFYTQWMALKAYANSKGLLIMGDIPFYVGIDSLDVWGGRKNFLLDSEGRPTFIAGVPPDYFSVTGQRWGNPIYNWEQIEADGFQFWIDRLSYNSKLYDIVRIDHFRAFDTYWKIPASCETAVEGQWLEAPGYALLDTVFKALPELWLIAEDLGDLRPEVLTLRDHYDLQGMYVAQFNLGEEAPQRQQVAYTGTHDNQTSRGWYQDLSPLKKRRVNRVLKPFSAFPRERVSHKMIRYICMSKALIAVAPVSDILALDDAARLNTPGTVGSPNWEWRLTGFAKLRRQIPWVRALLEQSGRI